MEQFYFASFPKITKNALKTYFNFYFYYLKHPKHTVAKEYLNVLHEYFNEIPVIGYIKIEYVCYIITVVCLLPAVSKSVFFFFFLKK